MRDLEVRYDQTYLRRRADGDDEGALPEEIVGLHTPARMDMRVMLRKDLTQVLFPHLHADSQGGPGRIVWIDDGSLSAAVSTLDDSGANSPQPRANGVRRAGLSAATAAAEQLRCREGMVCEVIWEATGKQISYPTGLLGEYRLALYDPLREIKSRILSAGGCCAAGLCAAAIMSMNSIVDTNSTTNRARF